MSQRLSWINEIAAEVINYYRSGHSVAECASHFGNCNDASIYRLLKRNKVLRRSLSEANSLKWTEDRRREKSIWLREQWANPNTIYNDRDFIKSRIRYGKDSNFYGVHRYGKDNNMYGKTSELSPFFKKARPKHVIEAMLKGLAEANKRSGGVWNKGLTKETDWRITKLSQSIKNIYADSASSYNSKQHIDKMNRIFWNCILSFRRREAKNETEQRLYEIIEEVATDEYKRNGRCELGFRIHRHVPDFVNVNGRKKVIELHGCYWHCCPECGIERNIYCTAMEARARDKRYRKQCQELGFDLLFVWQHELKNIAKLKDKILEFNER